MTLTKSATGAGTPRSAAGFSMIELVVSLGVMLTLTALAVPSLMRSLRTYQVNSAAARLADMMKYTRFEAVRQNKKMSLLLAASGTGWVVWTGPSNDTAPSPTEKQLLIAGFASLVTAGAPAGPNVAGSGALTMLSGSVCTPACFAFDARGAVSNLQGYVMYIGGINDPDTSYRAIVLLPSGSTQIWSAPAGGPWRQVN